MHFTNDQLIAEVMMDSITKLNDEKTRKKYHSHLNHFSEYLCSTSGNSFYDATEKDINRFMGHLKMPGGADPHPYRKVCSWCASKQFPDGRARSGWAPSTRKGYLSAIRFLYDHFSVGNALPDIDPTEGVKSPDVRVGERFTPTSEDMRRILAVSGSANENILTIWMAYVPERREVFSKALWRQIDLSSGFWEIYDAKNGRRHTINLHPLVLRALRVHREHQEREALTNPGVKKALSDQSRAFVLLTKSGARLHPSTLTKLIKQRGVRAGVGLFDTDQEGSVGGKNSSLTPHALRRGWATTSSQDGLELPVISAALGHADISTTNRHYITTPSEQVQLALVNKSY